MMKYDRCVLVAERCGVQTSIKSPRWICFECMCVEKFERSDSGLDSGGMAGRPFLTLMKSLPDAGR